MSEADFDPKDLDQIAEQFAGAIRNGDRPSVKDYVAQYGDSSGQLRRLLSSIEMIEHLKQDTIESGVEETRETPSIQQLDDYAIVREIGRGGMGIVFEAIHQSLGQRVAIKVLAEKLLGDSKHLARFRREARAAAKLRHTSIVPVFGVGTAEGHHYYVMDFIDGMSLQQWLEHLSGKPLQAASTIDENLARTDVSKLFTTSSDETELEAQPLGASPTAVTSPHYAPWAAGIVATICDALQYAHAQGVLHRDIKPANLLLDSEGEVWIADFGLAKLNEQHAVTVSGDVVGTPQYMPPESIDGCYDVASEVYAVGLTLYELLTLKPAISGKSPGDVIRKASQGVSLSPRKLNPKIPRDLETIVLKSLAREPGQRYASAGEMRDDLRRYLAHQPISARPFSRIERGICWARREPVVASLTGATFALLLALAIVSAFAYLRTRDALEIAQQAQSSAEELLEQKDQAFQLAEDQRIRAGKNLEVAISAFDEIMNSLADRGLEPDSEFLGDFTDTTSSDVTPQDAALLQSLLGFFDQLAANNSEDLLSSSAVAARHAADIYLRLGKLSQADRTYSESLSRYRRLQEIEGDNRDNLLSQAAIMNELAMIAGLRGNIARANQLFQGTCDLLEASPEVSGTREGRFEAARAYRLYASLRARAGLESHIAKGPPFESPSRRRRPLQMMLQVRTEDELEAVQQSIELLQELTREYTDDLGYRAELARAHRDRAIVADRAGMSKVAESSARSAIELFEQLLQENPNSDAIRYELAMTLSSTEAFNAGQLVRSLRANQLSETLLSESPELPRYRALRAHAKKSLASQQFRIGRLRPAEDNLVASLKLYDELISDTEELNLYETQRSGVLELLADVKLRQGDRAAAIDYLERAIRRLQPWLKRNDASPIARLQLQRLRQKLGRIEKRS